MSARLFVCVETTPQKREKSLHEIQVPALNEPDGYEQLHALDIFQAHQTKYAKDKETVQKVYVIKIKDEWVWETKKMLEMLQNQQGKLCEEYPETPNHVNSPEEISRKTHQTVWDFFHAIGFNHQTKKYTEPEDLIPFSIDPPNPEDSIG